MGRRWLLLECLVLCCVFISVLCSVPRESGIDNGDIYSRTVSSNSRRRRPLQETRQGGHLYYSSNYGDQPSLVSRESEWSCGLVNVYRQNIPAGYTNETITQLTSASSRLEPEECANLCCRRGTKVCQYAWLFGGRCYAVSCTKETRRKCLPQSMDTKSESIYIDLGFHWPDESDLDSDEEVTVSFEGGTHLMLPQNSTHISAVLEPGPDSNHEYYYKWKKMTGPTLGALEDTNRNDIWLLDLAAGVYVLRLTVSNKEGAELGVGTVNVTVHPDEKVPPVAVIRPEQHLSFTLPRDSAVFDASGSHDGHSSSDNLYYHWEEVTGPKGSSVSADSAILQLHNLEQGDYKFKLTVTNEDNLSAVEYATVSVKPQPYYPPQAVAKGDLVIHLPNDEVTIYGSRSKAYEGPLQYSWESLLRPGPLDLKGTSEAVLHVTHISAVGDYVFRLKVTDSRGSSSTTNVSVVVLPEKNVPPVADPGPNHTVWYPTSSATLNGSGSSDDYKIISWQWTQVSGPGDVLLAGELSPVLDVSGLHIDESVGSPTTYQFQLIVWDYLNITDTANVTITYYKNPAVLPRVLAGPDISLILPQDTAILNGSKSYDDFGITSFQWVRSDDSPAAGLVIGHSDRCVVLVVSGLVVGVYSFTLTVTNRNNLSASDTVIVTVFPPPLLNYMLQLVLELDHKEHNSTNTFTVSDKRKLQRVMGLMLNDITLDYDVIIAKVQPHGMHQLIDFYATSKNKHIPLNATVAYQKLTGKGQNFHYPESDFIFVKFEMKVCELPCSGHGYCNQKTHKCRCSRFWMENPLKANFGSQETNCDWSIFYVTLVALVSGAVVFFIFWLTCWCCMRKRKLSRSKRRVRYAILDRKHLEEGQEMLPQRVKGGFQQTSLMLTESDTEEELLFESKILKEMVESRNGSTGASPIIRTNHRSRSTSRTRGGSTPS